MAQTASLNLPSIAFLDRRITRMLWKFVDLGPSEAYIVPTRWLVALLILFEQIAYPEQLFEMTFQRLARGYPVYNRIPYEMPSRLLLSMCVQSAQDSFLLLDWLRNVGSFATYKEETIPVDLPRFGLGDEIPRDWLAERLMNHVDTRDRWLGLMVQQEQELQADLEGYESIIATLMTTISAHATYPALMLPEIAERWFRLRNSPLYRVAQVHQKLLARLPIRLLGFNDLRSILQSPAVAALREAVNHPTGSALDDPVDAALNQLITEIEHYGFSYREAILQQTDFSPLGAPFGHAFDVTPVDEVIKFIDHLPALVMHQAMTALTTATNPFRLMLVPGTELWIPPINDMELVEIYSNAQLGNPNRNVYFYEPC
ncbi:MAG: hypothetical protein ABI700_00820 [Chloroflexota bacterium]